MKDPAKEVSKFAKYAKKKFESGELGNNFGKNQVGTLIYELALDYLTLDGELEPEEEMPPGILEDDCPF